MKYLLGQTINPFGKLVMFNWELYIKNFIKGQVFCKITC